MQASAKYILSSVVILIALGVFLAKYWHYVTNPWTRDGQVHAQVIQINSRVSGPIVDLPIRDNQLVKAGDLLFKIDPRTFEAAVEETNAKLQEARVKAENAKEEADRERNISKRDAGAVSKQTLQRKINSQRQADAAVLSADAAHKQSQLDLEFTRVKAPVDGYITNLNLRLGSQAVANQPVLALIDISSFWVSGYFREDTIEGIQPGDPAIVTLMSYPDKPLQGKVDSLGWGIAQQDGSTGYNLLPNISATFEWIRLAQRVPVRIQLEAVPDDVSLRVGTTASVLVMAASAGKSGNSPAVAAPRALQ